MGRVLPRTLGQERYLADHLGASEPTTERRRNNHRRRGSGAHTEPPKPKIGEGVQKNPRTINVSTLYPRTVSWGTFLWRLSRATRLTNKLVPREVSFWPGTPPQFWDGILGWDWRGLRYLTIFRPINRFIKILNWEQPFQTNCLLSPKFANYTRIETRTNPTLSPLRERDATWHEHDAH